MQEYKRAFIDFMVRSDVLTFGDFTTKSGRRTPFFINTGRYRNGEQLARLGEFYAAAIDETWPADVDVLFGPAYKGIPLVATASIGLAARGRNVGYLFNRKEAKDHGEGGVLVGSLPSHGDRILIVEDVTTAGTSIRETVPMLNAHADVEVVGLIVSADRQERGTGDLSGLDQVALDFDMPTRAIVTLDDIVEHLHGRDIDGTVVLDDPLVERIQAYREEYGA
ncbi:MAG: orotate phosphoribosyltransferase [Actinomycetota bacterium]